MTAQSLLLLSTLLSTIGPAPSLTTPGELPRVHRVGHPDQTLPLRHTDVRAVVTGPVARVEVTQTYENDSDDVIEVVYVFPLPENSAVDAMRFTLGDRVIEGRIEKREAARKQYEAAKAQGKTAALLEQDRANVFRQRVANIGARERIDVVISYVQDLTYDDGWTELVFPMVVGPRFVPPGPRTAEALELSPPLLEPGVRPSNDIALEVTVEAGFPVVDVEAPTHEVDLLEADGAMTATLRDDGVIPNRDFVLRWKVATPELQVTALAHKPDAGAPGHATVVLQPPDLDVEAAVGRRELVFVVDVSGSMMGAPTGMAKTAVREAVRRLRPTDTFDIITFAGQTRRLFDAPAAANDANIRHALRFLDGIVAGGGTMMSNAVTEALHGAPAEGRVRHVLFVTDGYVSNDAQIIAQVGLFARNGRSRTFALGTGSSVNRALIRGIAEAGHGVFAVTTTTEEPLRAVDRFYAAIDRAILTDVQVTLAGGAELLDMEPATLPDLFASRPTLIHLRYRGGGPSTLVVTGTSAGRAVRRELALDLPRDGAFRPALATLFARSRIERHERSLWASPSPEDAVKAEAAIVALGLEHRIVTRWTSFVAIDNDTRVGDGHPRRIEQPAPAPAGTAFQTLGAYGGAGVGFSGGGGGMGIVGYGVGGSGVGHGRIMGLSRMDTGGGFKIKKVALVRSASAAKVRLGKATAKGATAFAALVQRYLQRRSAALKACYRTLLTRKPAAAGRLRLVLDIAPNGGVSKVSVQGAGGAFDAGFEACVTRVARRLRLPGNARPAHVVIPLQLAP